MLYRTVPVLEDAQQLVIRGDVVEVFAPFSLAKNRSGFQMESSMDGSRSRAESGVLAVGQPRVVPLLAGGRCSPCSPETTNGVCICCIVFCISSLSFFLVCGRLSNDVGAGSCSVGGVTHYK